MKEDLYAFLEIDHKAKKYVQSKLMQLFLMPKNKLSSIPSWGCR